MKEKVAKKFLILLVSLILAVIFLIPRIIVLILKIIESIIYIIRSTITFLIEQSKAEALNSLSDGKINEEQ